MSKHKPAPQRSYNKLKVNDNPYHDVHHLFTSYGIFKRRSADWRLVLEPLHGNIQGLENSYGLLLATNGILCLIQRNDHVTLFEGHLDYFVPNRPSQKTIKTSNGEFEIGKKVQQEMKKKSDLIVKNILDDLLKGPT